jgi:hypothetical protein
MRHHLTNKERSVSSRTRTAALIGLTVTLGLTACGDEAADASGPQTIAVTGTDYAFEELPDQVTAGSTLTLTNASDAEVHEIVAIRINDASDLSVDELVELPDEELDDHLAPGPPATVIVAMPGDDGIAVVGDGTLTEPGRYALVCFIPTGADPGELLAAFESEQDGPPDIEGGEPHALLGMYAELRVVEE